MTPHTSNGIFAHKFSKITDISNYFVRTATSDAAR